MHYAELSATKREYNRKKGVLYTLKWSASAMKKQKPNSLHIHPKKKKIEDKNNNPEK